MTLRPLYLCLPCLACLLACSAVNLLYFPPGTAFPDEARFLASAIRLASSGEFWVGADRAWEMPGTAVFYAAVIYLFGPQNPVSPIRFAQSILLAIQCALIALTALRLFGSRTTALIAACIAALYPFLLFYQGLLLSETLFDTFLLAGMLALLWWRDRGARIDMALVIAMALFALATLTKATLTFLPPLLMAATAWIAGISLRRSLVILATALCLYAACLAPWWIRNATLFHSFVPLTTGAAMNLYLGNNPRNLTGGISWTTDVDYAEAQRLQAIPDEIERQRAFSRLALDYIKAEPLTFVRNAAKKFVRFWNVVPNAAEYQTPLYAVITALSFGPVLLLALGCAAWRWRQWRGLAPIYLMIGYFTFVHVVTIASLRYRLPIEPLLIILAAAALGPLANWRGQRGTATRPA
jgi:4-amino-4-deoxy-L-arabinose transferase-like glycosyltransferase